jgi:hypothetical protein
LIIRGEGGERLGGRIVAGVRLRRGKAVAQRLVSVGDARWRAERLAREAAVAAHVEAAVPRGRQGDLELHLGLDDAVHAAELGRIVEAGTSSAERIVRAPRERVVISRQAARGEADAAR